jgi:hypothetical protein
VSAPNEPVCTEVALLLNDSQVRREDNRSAPVEVRDTDTYVWGLLIAVCTEMAAYERDGHATRHLRLLGKSLPKETGLTLKNR